MEVLNDTEKTNKKPETKIPNGWRKVKLKDAVKFLDGKRKPIKESDRQKMSGNFPYYGASGIIDYINDYIFDDDLILLGEDGANILNRSSRLAFKVQGKIWVNNHAHVLKPNETFDIDFLNDYLESLDYRKYNTSLSQPKLNKAECEKILILAPPYNEQKKIGQILSTWDQASENTQKLIDQLELRKKGLMQELLSGKKRLSGFDGEWKANKLGDYFNERKDTGYIDLPLLSVGKNGVYPQDNSEKKDTSNSNKSKYKRICPNDIGYNTMRMWQGRSALSDMEGIVSPAYTILEPKENCDSLFFSYLFKLDSMVHKFYRNSQGMVSDTWMCKYKDLSIIKFMAPPELSEQKAIAQVLKTVDEELQQMEIYLENLRNQKKGLMQQLLTGKKRVNV